MSAFLVSRDTIDALVTAWVELARHGRAERLERATETARMLIRENIRSIEARYGAAHNFSALQPEDYEFKPVAFPRLRPDTAVPQVLKLVHCYEYQACETSDWEETMAHAWCRTLEREAIHHIPGYHDADWDTADRGCLTRRAR
jgi:hypothetical protein